MQQGGHVPGQSLTAIGNRDPQLSGTVRDRDRDKTAIRRRGARVQEKIQRDLADRRPVDRERLGDAVIPFEMEVPRIALMLDEEAQIVEIDPGQNVVSEPPL